MELKEHKIGLSIKCWYNVLWMSDLCGQPGASIWMWKWTANYGTYCEKTFKTRSCYYTSWSIKRCSTQQTKVILKKKTFWLELSERAIPSSSSTTHISLLRSETNENVINIEERLKLARRTLYALISTEVHEPNGLNPHVSYKIYQCYFLLTVFLTVSIGETW